jgi:hypothetical protein
MNAPEGRSGSSKSCPLHDRFSPKNRHSSARIERPFRAKSCREQVQQMTRRLCAYSIASSARASSVGGISMPSAFAVLRLITNSYLVGACTGRSAGFSPLRMRST